MYTVQGPSFRTGIFGGGDKILEYVDKKICQYLCNI